VSFDPSLPEDGINVSPTYPLREAVVLVVAITGVVAVGAVLLTLLIDRLVAFVPPSLEQRIFSGLVVEAPGDAAPDPRVARVQALLERLLEHWPEHAHPVRVEVLDEALPNAFAFPGGRVILTRGLLDQVESENELAFILGHELGHYRGRDHLSGLGRGLALSLVMAALGGGAELAGLAAVMAQRGFDRDQEREADAFGLSLVATEYGHVAGAWDLFEHLPDPESVFERGVGSYLATHPLDDERIAALQALARERDWSASPPTEPF